MDLKTNLTQMRVEGDVDDRHFVESLECRFSITSNETHNRYHLLPPKNVPCYYLRRQRLYNPPICRTNRFKNTFIPSMSNFTDYKVLNQIM